MGMAAPHVHERDAFLNSEGEEAWQQLRRQFELADGFWLGFVFCPSPRTAAVLRRRTGQILKFQARRIRVIRPGSPEEFGNVLPALFESNSSHAGCVWVESIHADSATLEAGAPGDWTLAWDRFFLRANERRDAMRRHLGGGLILAAPPEVKPRARDAAPDLWSVRSLVLDLRPSTSDSGGRVNRDSHVIREIRGGPENVPADSAVDVEFSLAEAERIIRRIEGKPEYSVHGLARILLRAVEGLLERGASQKAFDVARKTAELLRGRSDAEPLLVDALSSLGRAARAENDVAVASECLEESLALRRGLLDRYGETPESLRDLSISLGRVGDVRRVSGERSAATAAYEESLALRRRLLEGYGGDAGASARPVHQPGPGGGCSACVWRAVCCDGCLRGIPRSRPPDGRRVRGDAGVPARPFNQSGPGGGCSACVRRAVCCDGCPRGFPRPRPPVARRVLGDDGVPARPVHQSGKGGGCSACVRRAVCCDGCLRGIPRSAASVARRLRGDAGVPA